MESVSQDSTVVRNRRVVSHVDNTLRKRYYLVSFYKTEHVSINISDAYSYVIDVVIAIKNDNNKNNPDRETKESERE